MKLQLIITYLVILNSSTGQKMEVAPTLRLSQIGKAMIEQRTPNRETAFVHSINAAAVTYFLTRDCRRGIFRNCACVRQTGQAGEWRGCNDNVKFGEVLSKHFLNARHVDKRKARAVIHLHNNAVGRKDVKKTLKQQCKCHAVSGGCSSKSCWKTLPLFSEIGDYLKAKYQEAQKVRLHTNKLVLKLPSRVFAPLTKKARRSLVFLKPSPDYCHRDTKKGSTGVLGRECSSDSPNYLECIQMCTSCDFRVEKKLAVRSSKCKCKFVWCCDIKCSECKKLVAVANCVR
ncbi:protein Wnt-8b [Nematostella vectensis]|uniref:protein Wnt-8b n=1 Tax=Nematostella vectensis TaxID=45351 RepID=UPI00207728F0|nr:protein Wnt-8b [Nematostella vectensis]